MVSTHMRGAVIFTSAYKVFLPPSHRDVDIQFHAYGLLHLWGTGGYKFFCLWEFSDFLKERLMMS